jgi:hypothetical protein
VDDYLKKRPLKKRLPADLVESLKKQAVAKLKSKLLPDDKIIKIILIGSTLKNSFGQYDPPGFRGSLYSDFDFIIFVEDNYVIPKWLEREPDGKPFPDNELNLAYRSRKFIENKYDAETFFIKRSNMINPKIQELGELAGIPMTETSKHKHLVVYSK